MYSGNATAAYGRIAISASIPPAAPDDGRTNDIEEFNRITGLVTKHNGKILDIKTVEPSLERYFWN